MKAEYIDNLKTLVMLSEPKENYVKKWFHKKEIIETREQIQEDLVAYLEGIVNCIPVDIQDDELLTDVCNIVVRNFDKLED